MTLPTVLELLTRSAAYLSERGITNGRRETEWIFADTLGWTRLDLYTRFDTPLESEIVSRLRERVVRRGKREPLAYVLGSQPFAGVTLHVGSGVLVPRPETEELIEHVLAALPESPLRIIDVGTGSGAIALACKKARPAWSVEAVDISAEALVIARANGEALGLTVEWRLGDLLAEAQGFFAGIIANLPYIAESEADLCDPELAFEPRGALFSGADGLDAIRSIMPQIAACLAPDGIAWLEHGFRQAGAVRALAEAAGLQATTIPDLGGQPRFARICRLHS